MQVYKPTLTRFASAGGLIGSSPAEVCKGNWRHSSRSRNNLFVIYTICFWCNNLFVSDAFSRLDVDVLVIMVTNEAQAESALYGDFGAISGKQILLSTSTPCFISTNPIFLCFIALPSGASIILSSTVSPGFVSRLDQRLQSMSSIPCHTMFMLYLVMKL